MDVIQTNSTGILVQGEKIKNLRFVDEMPAGAWTRRFYFSEL